MQERPGRCVGVIGGNEQVRGASRLMPFEKGSPDKNHSWDLMRSSWSGSSDPCQTAAATQRPEHRQGQVPVWAGIAPRSTPPQSSHCTASCTIVRFVDSRGSGRRTKNNGVEWAGSESVVATKQGERNPGKSNDAISPKGEREMEQNNGLQSEAQR